MSQPSSSSTPTGAVEARALRRSDVVKTAILRSVFHDLRSPLTGIVTAAEALGSPALRAHERDELAEGLVAEAQPGGRRGQAAISRACRAARPSRAPTGDRWRRCCSAPPRARAWPATV